MVAHPNTHADWHARIPKHWHVPGRLCVANPLHYATKGSNTVDVRINSTKLMPWSQETSSEGGKTNCTKLMPWSWETSLIELLGAHATLALFSVTLVVTACGKKKVGRPLA
jgi:hypothetical protein